MHEAIVIEDITKLKPHPAAELFPKFGKQELKELEDDIQKNGLLEPIALIDGMILDGRNRFQACQNIGITPTFVTLNGNCPSPTSYVLSKNLHRRHLTISQRAMIAARALPLLTEEGKQRRLKNLKHVNKSSIVRKQTFDESSGGYGNSYTLAAAATDVSRDSVHRALQVLKHDPEIANAVEAGTVTLGEARQKIGTARLPRSTKHSKRMGRPPQQGSPIWTVAVADHYKTLRAEITRRRKENHDDRQKRRWNPEDVVKRFQTELLDWIEQELDAVSKLVTGQGPKK